MLYSMLDPKTIDPLLVMALKNIYTVDNAGKITAPKEWAIELASSPAYPPAKWTRRMR